MEAPSGTTVQKALEAATYAAWEAILRSLDRSGILYDDCDGGIFVDDAESRKTFRLNVTKTECKYGGGS